MSFDPIIAVNRHIALLTARDKLKEEMDAHTGLIRAAAQGVGRMVMMELEKSKQFMRANQAWIAEQPVGERRYRYGHLRYRGEHEISQEDLDQYIRIAMSKIERELESKSNPG